MVGFTVGGVVGLVAGYYRRTLDDAIVAVLDIMLAIPGLVLALALVAFFAPPGSASPSEQTMWATIALSILAVPTIARVARAQTMVWADRDFVLASRTLGARNLRIIVRDVLPNILPAMFSFAFIGLAVLIVVEAALAFFGVGDVSGVSWGIMIQNGRSQVDRAPHMVLFPALFMFLTILVPQLRGRPDAHAASTSGRAASDGRVGHRAPARTAPATTCAGLALQVEHLVVEFPAGPFGVVHAVSDVSFDLADGETLGIVGESGCGKSTTAKAIMRVPPPTAGVVRLDGTDLATLDAEAMRDARSRLQMIFQDAISSLNPRRRIREVVAEPLVIRWLESHRALAADPAVGALRAPDAAAVAPPPAPPHRLPAGGGVLRRARALGRRSATGTEQDDGTRDGGIVQAAGTVVMVASLVGLAPIVALFVVTAAVWLVLSVLLPFAAAPRAFRLWRGRTTFWQDAERQGPAGARGRGHRRRHGHGAPAARVLGRPGPADLDRPGADPRPDGGHLRRAGLGARRVGPGPGAQPAGGAQGEVRALADLHRPRPRGREEHHRPGGGDVPRQGLRGGPARRAVRPAPPSRTPRS